MTIFPATSEPVKLHRLHRSPGGRLVSPERGDPAVQPLQGLGHGLDLAQGAAQVRIPLPKARAVLLGLLLRRQAGRHGADGEGERPLYLLFQAVRLGKEKPGVDEEHGDGEPEAVGHMGKTMPAGAPETARDGHPAGKGVRSPAEQRLGGGAGEAFPGVSHRGSHVPPSRSPPGSRPALRRAGQEHFGHLWPGESAGSFRPGAGVSRTRVPLRATRSRCRGGTSWPLPSLPQARQ